MSILLIQTGSLSSARARAAGGDFDAMFLRALGLPDGDVQVVRPFLGEDLPPIDDITGVLITGSPAMVTDREDWSERTADWLKRLITTRPGLPVLGVCYGHQLLAQTLGGRVDWNPNGPEYGVVEIAAAAGAAQDPLVSVIGEGGESYAAHYQSVMDLPPGAVALAANHRDPHQAVRYRTSVWGIQFHPEFTAAVMRGIIEDNQATLARAGLDADRALSYVKDIPALSSILRQFGMLASRDKVTPP